MNLPCERIECKQLRSEALERRYAQYLKDFTKKEFENEFLLSEDHIEEVFGYLASFIEDTIFTKPTILYAQSNRMLKFYKTHLRRKQSKILFISL
jgi:hypothetical protein